MLKSTPLQRKVNQTFFLLCKFVQIMSLLSKVFHMFCLYIILLLGIFLDFVRQFAESHCVSVSSNYDGR